jgi:predicted metalloprotease with PDZ domain
MQKLMKSASFALFLTCFCAFFDIAANAPEPVRYTLRFPKPQTHYLEVTAQIPVGKPQLELYMPVWTPGSYMVREYSRNVEALTATDENGRSLAVKKTRKNRWLVEAGSAKTLTVAYKVYANEPSVQGNYVDAGFAMLNGAANFVTIEGDDKRAYEVKLELPAAWKESISGLKQTGEHAYVASDFDQLLDSPIYAGNAPIHEFEVDGKKHYLVNEGEGPMWDGAASAKDVAKIVAEYSRMWGGLPYDHYVFFNMLIEAGGGLEHKNSTWMGGSKWAYGNTVVPPPSDDPAPRGTYRPNRLGWLGLVSHEYFHLWNVKRLRPAELGPFDYEQENYTRSLWLAEGVTSYYGELALGRTKLATRDQALQSFSGAISGLQNTPGRLVTPLEQNSFDAWIKLYHSDENTQNTAISYYTKGEIVGLLLDAKIRKLTDGAKSLDDAMKLAYERYSGERGYTPEQFRATVNEVAGSDLGQWFQLVLDSTKELDYSELLDWYGLRFKALAQKPGAPPRIRTGLQTKTDNGRLVVSTVVRDTPGEEAGLNVGDEILGVNGYRLKAEQWPSRLESYKPGETVKLLVAHRDMLQEVNFVVTADNPVSWQLEVRPDATDAQKAHLKAWLRE